MNKNVFPNSAIMKQNKNIVQIPLITFLSDQTIKHNRSNTTIDILLYLFNYYLITIILYHIYYK